MGWFQELDKNVTIGRVINAYCFHQYQYKWIWHLFLFNIFFLYTYQLGTAMDMQKMISDFINFDEKEWIISCFLHHEETQTPNNDVVEATHV